MKPPKFSKTFLSRAKTAGVFLAIFIVGYNIFLAGRILPRVHVGTVNVGLLTKESASIVLSARADALLEQGITLKVNGVQEVIHLESVNFSFSPQDAAAAAWQMGHEGTLLQKVIARLAAPFLVLRIPLPDAYDPGGLELEVNAVARLVDKPRTDIRLVVKGTAVDFLTDTKPGKVIDRDELRKDVIGALKNLDASPISVEFKDDLPRVSADSVPQARRMAENILSEPLALSAEGETFYVSREQIGVWLTSEYEGDALIPGIKNELVSEYVATIAAKVNIAPQKPKITFEGERVAEFVPPYPGKALEETKTVEIIVGELVARRDGKNPVRELVLPVKATSAFSASAGDFRGIIELVGKATTPFTGSPANRIHNIKNGVKFLTGLLVQPGEEFSTLKALGEIDNAAGYLPELVIKGTSTVPEYGGGLCQVSTTLFRAVMNAGLPITARRNHSYRVSYYEKDGTGHFIGPGLDATIYDPDPDFRFKNDTANPILIFGYVKGDKATFELYGTRDGRKSEIIGPKILSETPAGPAVYVETNTLAKGVTKQIETPHPGGSATATYIITYADGTVDTQEFKSWYRRWPAKYLVGIR